MIQIQKQSLMYSNENKILNANPLDHVLDTNQINYLLSFCAQHSSREYGKIQATRVDLVSTWSITASFQSFCLVSNLEPEKGKYASLQPQRMPCFWLAFLVSSCQPSGYTWSLSMFLLESFYTSVFESLPNARDEGWLPCYGKLWINVFCLFSFECSLFPHLEFTELL